MHSVRAATFVRRRNAMIDVDVDVDIDVDDAAAAAAAVSDGGGFDVLAAELAAVMLFAVIPRVEDDEIADEVLTAALAASRALAAAEEEAAAAEPAVVDVVTAAAPAVPAAPPKICSYMDQRSVCAMNPSRKTGNEWLVPSGDHMRSFAEVTSVAADSVGAVTVSTSITTVALYAVKHTNSKAKVTENLESPEMLSARLTASVTGIRKSRTTSVLICALVGSADGGMTDPATPLSTSLSTLTYATSVPSCMTTIANDTRIAPGCPRYSRAMDSYEITLCAVLLLLFCADLMNLNATAMINATDVATSPKATTTSEDASSAPHSRKQYGNASKPVPSMPFTKLMMADVSVTPLASFRLFCVTNNDDDDDDAL